MATAFGGAGSAKKVQTERLLLMQLTGLRSRSKSEQGTGMQNAAARATYLALCLSAGQPTNLMVPSQSTKSSRPSPAPGRLKCPDPSPSPALQFRCSTTDRSDRDTPPRQRYSAAAQHSQNGEF